MNVRKIILIDLDAYFASVEQRDKPFLRGKPVIVCSDNNRGVVSTASYEARYPYGIHSAMPVFKAKKLCPKGYFIVPDFQKYEKISQQIYDILHEYTDVVEGAGLDEAYLDVTINKKGIPSATWIAQDIRYEIFNRIGLTASAGISYNKLVAKIASDYQKPNGLTVVTPEQAREFLKDLPVRKIPGIGPKTEQKLVSYGIKKISDFLKYDDDILLEWFGKSGPIYKLSAQGLDDRPLITQWDRKSCGIEDTFERDFNTKEEAAAYLKRLANKLEKRLTDDGVAGRTITLKVKYGDFRQVTRRKTLQFAICDQNSIFNNVFGLINQTEIGKTPVRLLGIALSQLQSGSESSVAQPGLFDNC